MAKLKSAIHYVVCNTDPEKLGSVKLAKILLFADMEYYRRTGTSITGCRYEKREHGPLVSGFNRCIDELKASGVLAERRGDLFGYPQRQFWATSEPDVSEFNPQEVAVLSWIRDKVCYNHTATSISDETHKNLAWVLASDGEEIPLSAFLAAYRSGTPTPEEIQDIEREIAQTQ
jgi:hypothetical protein